MNEDIEFEFSLTVIDRIQTNLDLHDDLFQAAAECDGDLGWLRGYVIRRLVRDRVWYPELWEAVPDTEPMPGSVAQEVLEMFVDEVRKVNDIHPVVLAWDLEQSCG